MPVKRRRGALLALVLVLGLGMALPAAAAPAPQPAGLTMTVQPAYGGYYKLGEWFPIQVTLSNTGATFDGAVQVDAIGTGSDAVVATYSRPVSLPAPARKQITLYTYAASYQHALAVRLVQDGRTVLQQQATLTPLNDAFLLGVVSDQPDLLNALSGTSQGAAGAAQPVTVAHLAPADLPESATALADLDALVVAGTDTSRLSAAARQALGGWVAGGGLLVVAGGTTGSATAAGLADLLPATVGDPGSAADLAALGTFAKAAAPPASGVPVSALQPIAARGAAVLAGTPAQPLIVQRALGSGAVVVLAVDPGQPPFPGWSGAPQFWAQVLGGRAVQASAAALRRTANNPFGAFGGSARPSTSAT